MKCAFGVSSGKFLGFIVTKKGIEITTRNPLIHDEFFVTFMNTVINRQDI